MSLKITLSYSININYKKKPSKIWRKVTQKRSDFDCGVNYAWKSSMFCQALIDGCYKYYTIVSVKYLIIYRSMTADQLDSAKLNIYKT